MSFVMGRCIGVDVGGTKIAAARVEPDGSLSRRFRADTRADEGPDGVIERICQGIEQVMGEEKVEGIGIACPGPLDARTGVVLSPPNLPGWDRIPLKDRLEERFGVPVRVENDANAAAWGEYLLGAGRGADPMVYITVSTGIGGGIVLDGRLYRGADTFAGEIGHTIVDPGGAPCSCGRRGCLEALASGTAIARAAAEAVRKGNRRIREAGGERAAGGTRFRRIPGWGRGCFQDRARSGPPSRHRHFQHRPPVQSSGHRDRGRGGPRRGRAVCSPPGEDPGLPDAVLCGDL